MSAHVVDSPRIGIAFSGGPSPSEIVDCVKLAESPGYESAWVAEGHGGDQFAVLAASAAQTSHILLGKSIRSVYVRTAPTIAMAALTLDDFRTAVSFWASDLVTKCKSKASTGCPTSSP